VLTCPCGKTKLESLLRGSSPRSSCTDPIPICESTCGKVNATSPSSCSHPCLSKCHAGPCPPCLVQIMVFCRCGQTSRYIPCSVHHSSFESGDNEIICDIKCSGMRHCGRHACGRVCCPLASASVALKKAKEKSKRGRGAVLDAQTLEDEDVEGWHTCDLVS
jgi:transcriptional repressor NF-X1